MGAADSVGAAEEEAPEPPAGRDLQRVSTPLRVLTWSAALHLDWTQLMAALVILVLLSASHWQAKSVAAQEVEEALASWMQGIYIRGLVSLHSREYLAVSSCIEPD